MTINDARSAIDNLMTTEINDNEVSDRFENEQIPISINRVLSII